MGLLPFREVIFLFACFPCFMITVPFILSRYSSRYWYKSSLLLINPRLRKLKPVSIRILLSVQGRLQSVAALRVDQKRLYMYKKGHFGGFRSRPLKLDTSIDDDTERQPYHHIRKGSING